LTTAVDGKQYNVTFYSLDMILAIGFRVRSKRGMQFRKWANGTLKEYMQKGFVMDDERLKNPDGRPDYYDELLERIGAIRGKYQETQLKKITQYGQEQGNNNNRRNICKKNFELYFIAQFA
jgi:hypothetical protein